MLGGLNRKKKEKKILIEKINKLIELLQESNLKDLVYIFGNKREIIKRNIIAGIARGVGIGIGVTIITAVLVFILQRIVSLNIPIIGEYIADIVDIVQKNR